MFNMWTGASVTEKIKVTGSIVMVVVCGTVLLQNIANWIESEKREYYDRMGHSPVSSACACDAGVKE